MIGQQNRFKKMTYILKFQNQFGNLHYLTSENWLLYLVFKMINSEKKREGKLDIVQ